MPGSRRRVLKLQRGKREWNREFYRRQQPAPESSSDGNEHSRWNVGLQMYMSNDEDRSNGLMKPSSGRNVGSPLSRRAHRCLEHGSPQVPMLGTLPPFYLTPGKWEHRELASTINDQVDNAFQLFIAHMHTYQERRNRARLQPIKPTSLATPLATMVSFIGIDLAAFGIIIFGVRGASSNDETIDYDRKNTGGSSHGFCAIAWAYLVLMPSLDPTATSYSRGLSPHRKYCPPLKSDLPLIVLEPSRRYYYLDHEQLLERPRGAAVLSEATVSVQCPRVIVPPGQEHGLDLGEVTFVRAQSGNRQDDAV
ncbi:hypothetical protein BKA70DRAFT_1221452 [Coprinopsis sp. MPI-PUGE-AT-0042]|nr:hypothetical protein BKA70DRAFT_1221452 [Coprinopsis sp. MPI-PUGE-AT-0042]